MDMARVVIDWAAIVDRFEGDVDLFWEIARLFVRDYSKRLCVIYDAVACNDCRTLERVAHSLKGTVGTLGAGRALDAVGHLEELARAGNLDLARAQCAEVETEVARLVAVLAESHSRDCGRPVSDAPCVE